MEQAAPIVALRARNRDGLHVTVVEEPGIKERKASLSPVLSRRKLSDGESSSPGSPLQTELRRLNRMASEVAMAMTESHQSDDEDTTSDEEEDGEYEIVSELQEERDLLLPSPSSSKPDKPLSPALRARLSNLSVGSSYSNLGKPPSPVIHKARLSTLAIVSLLNMDEPPKTFMGRLEALDRRASRPLFMLDLGLIFECIMLVFGTWFGLPVPAWGLWTAFLAFGDEYKTDLKNWKTLKLFENEATQRRDISLALIILAFALYSLSFVRWIRKGKYQSVYGNLKQLVAVPMLFTVVFYYGTITKGHNAGAFFAVAWVAAEVVGHLLKYCFHRVRPVAYLAGSLPVRHFPEVQAMFSKGHTAFESFPSADTTGGAVFSAVLMLLEWVPIPVAVAVSLLTAFSRLYLQAHHLIDVGVGLLIGWGTTLIMWPLFGPNRYFGPGSTIGSVLFFVVFALVARKYKPKLPQHMQRAKSMYGF